MGKVKAKQLLIGPRTYAMTGTPADSHVSIRLWLRLLSCTNFLTARLRQKMRTEFGTTLPRFELMAHLEHALQGLTMSELSRRMMVSGANVTGITDRLEKRGFAVRVVDDADRRIFRVKLTVEGARQLQRMAAEHERWLIALFSAMSIPQNEKLARLLNELEQYCASAPERRPIRTSSRRHPPSSQPERT
jgi:DNA-binding MarR family transcriptional regulator